LLADNLPVHKTLKAKAFCSDNSIHLIFNVPYSLQFNAIEFFWKLVKEKFKRARLENLLNGEKEGNETLIRKSIILVERHVIKSMCDKTIRRILVA
jgi:transposase